MRRRMQAEGPRKRQHEALTTAGPSVFGPGKGVGGRVNPSQKGCRQISAQIIKAKYDIIFCPPTPPPPPTPHPPKSILRGYKGLYFYQNFTQNRLKIAPGPGKAENREFLKKIDSKNGQKNRRLNKNHEKINFLGKVIFFCVKLPAESFANNDFARGGVFGGWVDRQSSGLGGGSRILIIC